MGLRFCLSLLLSVIIINGGVRSYAQDTNINDQQIMTPVPAPNQGAAESSTANDIFLKRLSLRDYEAAVKGESLCENRRSCIAYVRVIKAWLCAGGVCDGSDKSKRVSDCFEGLVSKLPEGAKDEAGMAFCSLYESYNTLASKIFLENVLDQGMTRDKLIEDLAYLLALKKSLSAAEDLIKNYVGSYGPQWSYKWYRVMSGCRILALASTREQEEKDFSVWFGVVHGKGNCSDIKASEMRNACAAPGATSPIPPL